jgi:hypothetical protein
MQKGKQKSKSENTNNIFFIHVQQAKINVHHTSLKLNNKSICNMIVLQDSCPATQLLLTFLYSAMAAPEYLCFFTPQYAIHR